MPIYEQFLTAVKALREVQAELGQDPIPGQTAFPAYDEVLNDLGGLPKQALLLGIASDGLPVFLNLGDSTPGPLLLVGDRGSGKTAFLRMLVESSGRLFAGGEIHCAIFTNQPDEWREVEGQPHVMGIWAAYDEQAWESLGEIASVVQSGVAENTFVLLIVDGLDAMMSLPSESLNALAFLFDHGVQAGCWPLVTINAALAARHPDWLVYFRTRLYGKVAHPELAEELTHAPGAGLNTLFPGAQFCIRQRSRWMRFWLPSMKSS